MLYEVITDLDLTVGNEIHGLSRNAGVRFIPLYRSSYKFFVHAGHPLTLRQCGSYNFV